jgi:chemotaxis methyl-accepting protein methylase
MDDGQFRQLLNHFGYSWKGYRRVRKGVKRRVSRHMQQVGCRSIEEYLKRLESDSGSMRQFRGLMGVSVGRFFRDRALWKIMEERIVAELARENRGKVCFLSIGCACGEEVYSFRIVWDMVGARFRSMPELDLFATDINPDYLARAKEGRYPPASLKEMPREVRDRYFTYLEDEGVYRIAPFLQEGISWQAHDPLTEPLEGNFHIILLRNGILTYYIDEIKCPAFHRIVNCLSCGGYLIIGSHETLPIERQDLVLFGDTSYTFKRMGQGAVSGQ